MENREKLGLYEYTEVLTENINPIIFEEWKNVIGDSWENAWTELSYSLWNKYSNSKNKPIKNDAEVLESSFFFTAKYLNK